MFYKECGILTLKNYTTYSQKRKNKYIYIYIYIYIKFVNPRSTYKVIWTRLNVSVRSRLNWNLEVLVFEESEKPEYPEKNLSEQGREPTTNSTHIWRRRRDLNPGHIGGKWALPLLRHPCSPTYLFWAWKRKSFRAGPPSPRIGIIASFPSGP